MEWENRWIGDSGQRMDADDVVRSIEPNLPLPCGGGLAKQSLSVNATLHSENRLKDASNVQIYTIAITEP